MQNRYTRSLLNFRRMVWVLLAITLIIAPGNGALADYTDNPPQPRGKWTSAHPNPPSEVDPRLMEHLPPEQAQKMDVIPHRLSAVMEARYGFGTAVGPDGSVYFTEYNRRNIVRIHPDGRTTRINVKTEMYGLGGFYGIAVDHDNNIFVAVDSDINRGGILRIGPDGHEHVVVSGFNRPRQITVDQNGHLYIVLESENRILFWNRNNGQTETVVTSAQTSMPQGVAVDAAGNIYFSEYGSVGHEGVILSAGRVRVKHTDGTFSTVADGFWRARGLAIDAQGDLYLTTEANAWDNSDSGLIVRIKPNGAVETLVQGINYPQFPAIHPNGKLYVTMTMDNLLVAMDPNQQYNEVEWDALPNVGVFSSNGVWLPESEAGGQGIAMNVRVENLVMKGRVIPQSATEPVSIWLRLPVDMFDLYLGELPYTVDEFPTPGRYQLPEVRASVGAGSVQSLGLPARTHVGSRWPMIIGYTGPEYQYYGREWPHENFDDAPEAYLVYLEWDFTESPVIDFQDTVYLSREASFGWAKTEGATSLHIEQTRADTYAWTAADTGVIAPNATSATVTGLEPGTEYLFRLVTVGGHNAGRSNIKSFITMPTYTLTYSAGEGGVVVGDTEQTVDYRGSGTAVTAAAESGYRFVRWSDDVTDATRTDSDVTAALTVSAEFAVADAPAFSDVQYLSREATFGWTEAVGAAALRIEQSPLHTNEWTTASTGAIAVNATSATVTGLTPATEYKFRLVVTGGANAGVSNIRSFTTMPTYALSYSADVGGSVTGELEQTVDYRGSGTAVTAVPDAGFQFVRWSDDVMDATRTDTDVTAAVQAVAEFASSGDPVTDFADVQYLSREATFGWTAAVGAAALRIEQSPLHTNEWTTAGTGTIAVNAASATVTGLTPATDYKFRLVVTGGANAGVSNVRSFTTMPTYTLSYSAGAGGSVTGELEQTVDYRGSGTAVTAVPDAGYRFVKWSDGLTDATRTDADVTAGLVIGAEFAVDGG